MVLPRFRAQGKAYVHIAFGCTGGRHRSVFMTEQIGAALREADFHPQCCTATWDRARQTSSKEA
jgi:UPF0042 nucleotide-binding protein